MARTTMVWNISLFPEMAREVELIAGREFRTRSELVREALRQYLWSVRLKRSMVYGQKKAVKLGILNSDIEQLVDEMRK